MTEFGGAKGPYPIVEGRVRLTPQWSITLPYPMARRVEDGSLVLWRPGGVLTIWLSVFGAGGRGATGDRAVRLRSIVDATSDAAFDRREERDGDPWRYRYRLRERARDGRAAALYGFAVGDGGHMQFAAYFDEEATVEVAERIFRSLGEAQI